MARPRKETVSAVENSAVETVEIVPPAAQELFDSYVTATENKSPKGHSIQDEGIDDEGEIVTGEGTPDLKMSDIVGKSTAGETVAPESVKIDDIVAKMEAMLQGTRAQAVAEEPGESDNEESVAETKEVKAVDEPLFGIDFNSKKEPVTEVDNSNTETGDEDPILAEMRILRAELNELKSSKQSEMIAQAKAEIDNVFDKEAGDYPELGISSKLDESAIKLRKEIATLGQAIKIGIESLTGSVIPNSKAVELALSSYIGKNGEKKAESKLRKNLQASKEQLSLRPSRRNQSRQFKDDTEEALAGIQEYVDKQGLKF